MASKFPYTVGGKAGYRIQFVPNGQPKTRKATLWLPEFSEHEAETFKKHIEHMLGQLERELPFGKSTQTWLDGLPVRFHTKLAKFGFLRFSTRRSTRGIHFRDGDTEQRTHFRRFVHTTQRGDRQQEAATQVKLIQAMDCLTRFPGFGLTKKLSEITEGDAEEWRVWLLTKGNIREGKKRKGKDGKLIQGRTDLSENTVRRRSGLAKQIFGFARKLKWIQENPFDELVASVTPNEARQFFVDRKTIAKAIEAAPDELWKGIIAMARFGGLRIPSELAGLRWMDIDFESGRIRIHSPKTEHHAGRAVRWCPIFPELRPYLQALADKAQPGSKTPIADPVFPVVQRRPTLEPNLSES